MDWSRRGDADAADRGLLNQ